MRRLKRTSLLLMVVLFATYACDLSSLNLTGQNPIETPLAQTLTAILAASQPAFTPTLPVASATGPISSATPAQTSTPTSSLTSTLTPTITQTPTATLTPSSTPTTMPSYTPTPVIPSIRVSVPTNCRSGPGIPYDIEGALLVGQMAQVLAVDPTRMFWYIPNPDSPGDYCWVWGQYATISGGTYLLPVYTPPPSPTATVTETPAPGFDLSFEGLVSCASSWWLQFTIKNTGLISFHSIGMILKDTDTDTTTSVISDSFFDQPDCSSSASRAQLLPGKKVTVSPVELGYDPGGHKIKATITLCSQDDQNGMCATETITFKP